MYRLLEVIVKQSVCTIRYIGGNSKKYEQGKMYEQETCEESVKEQIVSEVD